MISSSDSDSSDVGGFKRQSENAQTTTAITEKVSSFTRLFELKTKSLNRLEGYSRS